MTRIIADTYEIHRQIGAGGGGIVYLGRHLRLEKPIVLKADKRTLSTKAESLRREVDMLKGLSHTYIPQVYDFVQEDGVVYTVMDFIEGESLDKYLKRGELFSQPEIIRWACQLLEALLYLHGRPPYGILHGDIKPANIMLRPGGDICLIDYNIALALGEGGAVKAGLSRGYASPEHYGAEYESVSGSDHKKHRQRSGTEEEGRAMAGDPEWADTVWMTGVGEPTETMEGSWKKESKTGGRKSVMLDARSDIYSLGATLYHLLSGKCPDRHASAVKPLDGTVSSPQVSKIIERAMAPDPDKRYQSALEMLEAFRGLHRQDKRVKRRKRRIALCTISLTFLFLSGGAAAFAGMNQMKQTQAALALAEYSANRLREGDISGAVKLALEAMPEKKTILDAPVTAQAQKALTDALGVYNLEDGFGAVDTLSLPSAPFSSALSPGGSCLGVIYQHEAAVFDMGTLERIALLPAENSALSDILFVDETRIVYAGDQGVTAYDLEKKEILWIGEKATTLAVSGDKTAVAAVNRDDGSACVYRMEDGRKTADCFFEGKHMAAAANDIFANPGNRIFALNHTGDLLAVSFSDGGLRIFDLKQEDGDLIIFENTAYSHFGGGFYEQYFAFGADKSDESIFGLVDTKKGVYVGDYESRDPFLVQTDETGICFANGNLLVRFDPDTLNQTELAYTEDRNITGFSIGDKGYVLIATDDKGFSFYDCGANPVLSEVCGEACDFVSMAGPYGVVAGRNGPTVRILKKESHDQAQLMSYDARYLHDEARVSYDRSTVMLFDCEEFCVCDLEGKVICRKSLPDSRHIYDQQFRKSEEGSWLEVIWYDGTRRCYSAADGSVISESKGEAPSKDLYEEFFTDKYRIESSLHTPPQVYDLESNEKVAVLEEESYLTYVTQIGRYLITEYVSAEGERYGLLLDDRFQTLAYLPGLCDIMGDTLVFDYHSGNLRQCRLYSLQELKALGEAYLETHKREKGEKG